MVEVEGPNERRETLIKRLETLKGRLAGLSAVTEENQLGVAEQRRSVQASLDRIERQLREMDLDDQLSNQLEGRE